MSVTLLCSSFFGCVGICYLHQMSCNQAGMTWRPLTSPLLQVGISVAALAEIVRRLGPAARQSSTAEVLTKWLLPPTRASACRWGQRAGSCQLAPFHAK